MATGTLQAGDQLPTVRQVAVDLAINPNTVLRAYREMEIRGVARYAAGHGHLYCGQKTQPADEERDRQLAQLAGRVRFARGRGGIHASTN